MPLVFEEKVHFDPAIDDPIIWGDGDHGRFCLVIRPKWLMDKYGLKAQFDHSGAEKIIRKHWADFEQAAKAAHDAGGSNVIIGCFAIQTWS